MALFPTGSFFPLPPFIAGCPWAAVLVLVLHRRPAWDPGLTLLRGIPQLSCPSSPSACHPWEPGQPPRDPALTVSFQVASALPVYMSALQLVQLVIQAECSPSLALGEGARKIHLAAVCNPGTQSLQLRFHAALLFSSGSKIEFSASDKGGQQSV